MCYLAKEPLVAGYINHFGQRSLITIDKLYRYMVGNLWNETGGVTPMFDRNTLTNYIESCSCLQSNGMGEYSLKEDFQATLSPDVKRILENDADKLFKYALFIELGVHWNTHPKILKATGYSFLVDE